MKWIKIVLFILLVAAACWWFGLLDDFHRPWKAWANWIGYF